MEEQQRRRGKVVEGREHLVTVNVPAYHGTGHELPQLLHIALLQALDRRDLQEFHVLRSGTAAPPSDNVHHKEERRKKSTWSPQIG